VRWTLSVLATAIDTLRCRWRPWSFRELFPENNIGRHRRAEVVRSIPLAGVVAVAVLLVVPAHGRDPEGRYKDSPLHDWFEHLASGKGLCCSFADGYVVTDADWASKDGHYRVRVPQSAGSKEMVWVDVPDEAVITEPNKAGRTMVWPLYDYQGVSIRCFMPGTMT
jgi:hypothetical protein